VENILKIQNLSFGYEKERLLYNNFSLTLKKGEIKAIVGASGAGKSTLFELILGNLQPQNGTIHVTQKISEVFQDPYSSFHPSFEIISQIKDVANTKEIDFYLQKLSIDPELLKKLPHQLSGGQLQRCSILRAMLMQPELLLLDEPTSALDNILQLETMQLIVQNIQNFGVLLITHDLHLAQWCADTIIEI
jgi:peptide/nickel transport system ATP-binding protein